MKRASIILGSLAFAAFYQSCAPGHDMSPVGITYGVVLAVLSAILAAKSDSKVTAGRDKEAKGIVEKALAGEETFFYLYLRPFVLTNSVKLQNPSMNKIQDSLKPGRVQDYEQVLTDALEPSGITPIALGRPGETVGAGRYKTDEDNWPTVFRALASAASGILMVPSSSSGTLYEIRWLIDNDRIRSTVFLQPSRISCDEWLRTVNAYRDMGLFLPNHTHLGDGAIIKLGDDGNVVGSMPMSKLWLGHVGGQAIQTLKLMGEKRSSSEGELHRPSGDREVR